MLSAQQSTTSETIDQLSSSTGGLEMVKAATVLVITLVLVAYLWKTGEDIVGVEDSKSAFGHGTLLGNLGDYASGIRAVKDEGFLFGPNALDAPHEPYLDTDSQHADYVEANRAANMVLFAESRGNVMNRTGESNALGVETFDAGGGPSGAFGDPHQLIDTGTSPYFSKSGYNEDIAAVPYRLTATRIGNAASPAGILPSVVLGPDGNPLSGMQRAGASSRFGENQLLYDAYDEAARRVASGGALDTSVTRLMPVLSGVDANDLSNSSLLAMQHAGVNTNIAERFWGSPGPRGGAPVAGPGPSPRGGDLAASGSRGSLGDFGSPAANSPAVFADPATPYAVYDAVTSNQETLRYSDAPSTLGPVRQKEVLPPLGPGGVSVWGSTYNMGSSAVASRAKPTIRVAQVHREGNFATESTADGRRPDIPINAMGPYTDANYARPANNSFANDNPYAAAAEHGGPLRKGVSGGVTVYMSEKADDPHAASWGSPGGGFYTHNSKSYSDDTNRITGTGFDLLHNVRR